MIDYVKAKRHYIMALAIMFVVVSLSDTTYSLFLKEDTTEEFNYNTGILDLQFIEDEQIRIDNDSSVISYLTDDSGYINAATVSVESKMNANYLFYRVDNSIPYDETEFQMVEVDCQ